MSQKHSPNSIFFPIVSTIYENELTVCILAIVLACFIAHKIYTWNIALYQKIILSVLCFVAKLMVLQHYTQVKHHYTVRPRDCSTLNRLSNWASFSGYQCPEVDPSKVSTFISVQIYLMDILLSIFVDKFLYSCDSFSRSYGIDNIWLSLCVVLGSVFSANWIKPIIGMIVIWFGYTFVKAWNAEQNNDQNNEIPNNQNNEPNPLDDFLAYLFSLYVIPQNGPISRATFLKFSKFVTKFVNSFPYPYNFVLIGIYAFLAIIWIIAIYFGNVIYGDGANGQNNRIRNDDE